MVMAVLRTVGEFTARAVPYTIAPRPDGDAAELVADSDKLQRALGWRPVRSDLRDVVRDSWEFFERRRV